MEMMEWEVGVIRGNYGREIREKCGDGKGGSERKYGG